MPNVIDYAQTQLDRFEQRPFCQVDALAFDFLSYLTMPAELTEARTWQGLRLAELNRAEHYDHYFTLGWAVKRGPDLLKAMAASPRFRDVTLHKYVEKLDEDTQMQFSATTFILPDGSAYIAFKGTDNSLVGWKEDFNLCFQCPVPSQTEAVNYLTQAAQHCDGPLRLGGHSKGGNLAIYAATMCDKAVQDRIIQVCSHDGPGFLTEFMQLPAYRRLSPRISKIIPQSSVVGMLMEQGDYQVVESESYGVLQHDPGTWQVAGQDFVRLEQLNNSALFTDSTLEEWTRGRTREERELFIDTLYSLLDDVDAHNLGDLKRDWRESLTASARTLAAMDPETRNFTLQVLGDLLAIAAKNTPELFGVRELPTLASIKEAAQTFAPTRKPSE